MSETAETALAALARDLVEEIAAGRALELAQDDPGALELASFNVRAHLRRSPTGKVEQVREHTENRLGQGIPGDTMERPGNLKDTPWIPEPDWQKGEKEFIAKGEAVWKQNEWKSKGKPKEPQKVFEGIRDTRKSLPDKDDRYQGADQHLDQAQKHITERGLQVGQLDQNHLARAYHELGKAHEHIVRKVLPHANPEEYPQVAGHLQKIAGHMQDLDRAMGAKPEATRQLLGDFKENFAHAGEERRAQETRKAEEEARQAEAERTERPRQMEEEARKASELKQWQEETRARALREATANFRPDQKQVLEEQILARQMGMPEMGIRQEPLKGAAAVHPQLHGKHVTLPGDTLSGHAHAHVPRPFEVPQPTAQDKALGEANAALAIHRQAGLAQLEAQHAAARAERTGIPEPGTYAPLTDEQFDQHVDDLERAIGQALEQGLATDHQFTEPGNRRIWKPDRAMAHADIVRDYLDKQVDVPSQRAALFMGGLPGAGKSTLLKHHSGIDLKDYAVINPDDFKEELARRGMIPEVEGLSPMERVALVHEESVHLANLAAMELQRRGKNLAYDVTMKSYRTTSNRVKWLKRDHGYHVTAVFVDVPVEKSVERVAKRYRQGLEAYRQGKDKLGGRYVPAYAVRSGEGEPGQPSRARATFDSLLPRFDRWELYDGTKGKATLAAEGGRGRSPGGITSVEELVRGRLDRGTRLRITGERTVDGVRELEAEVVPYIGSTEAQARAAERGTAGGT